MKRMAVRWRVSLPLLLLLTILAPSLRLLPGSAFLPDPWLLAVLLLLSPPPVQAWRPALYLVLLAGLLRGSVSAVSPAAAWAGLGLGLVWRDLLFRRLRDDLLLLRLVTGIVAALPLAAFDFLAAERLGAGLSATEFLWRAVTAGMVWALLCRPPRLRTLFEGKIG